MPQSPALVAFSIDTPVGPVQAIASDVGLCGLPFTPDVMGAQAVKKRSRTLFNRRLHRWFGVPTWHENPTHPVIAETRAWLAAYFAGVAGPPLPPLDLRGTAFERRVWTALIEVPLGATATYGGLAERLGIPRASRAVGLANGANPVPIIVPCHRIIGASGTLTGYGGGLERKAWLLAHERRHWGHGGLPFEGAFR